MIWSGLRPDICLPPAVQPVIALMPAHPGWRNRPCRSCRKQAGLRLQDHPTRDAPDGLIARRLDAVTAFGAKPGSLSGFLCCGGAPGFPVDRFGPPDSRYRGVFVLISAGFACLHLPRHDMNRDAILPGTTRSHFYRRVCPRGSVLLALPYVIPFKPGFPITRKPRVKAPILCLVSIGLTGLNRVSQIDTPLFRAIKTPRDGAVGMLTGVVLIVGLAVARPGIDGIAGVSGRWSPAGRGGGIRRACGPDPGGQSGRCGPIPGWSHRQGRGLEHCPQRE